MGFFIIIIVKFFKEYGMKFWFRGTKCLPLARNKKHAAHKVLWLEATFLRGCVRFAWVVNLSPWWYFGKLRVNQLRFRHLPHPGCEGLQSFLFDSRHLIFVSLSLSLRLARYPTLPTVLENGMRIWATRTILSRLTGSKTKNLKSVKV